MISPIPLITPITIVMGALVTVLASLITSRKEAYTVIALCTSGLGLLLTGYTALKVLGGNELLVYGSGGWLPPLGIVYIVDGVSAILSLVTAVIVFLVVMYSHGYIDEGKGIAYYYAILLLLEAALIGVYYTGDFFNLFVMIELMAASAYSLVAYHRYKGRAIESSLKYGMAAAVAGIFFFIGLGFTYAYTGTLSIPDLSSKISGIATAMEAFSGSPLVTTTPILLIAGLIIWAFMLESAVFPLHFWLPDAHSEAPAPVSAMLSGLVVNAGLYASIRLFYTIMHGLTSTVEYGDLMILLNLVACTGALYASLMMLMQRDVKRIIAYSTVLHMSLLMIAITLSTRTGLDAAVYHFITHSVSKALAFLSVGALIALSGSRNIDSLKGLGRIDPLSSAGVIVAMLGLAGVPPFGTFPSKLFIITACVSAGNLAAAGVVVVSSTIAAVGYFRVINILINQPCRKPLVNSVSSSIKLVILVSTILAILVGVMIPWIYGYVHSSTNTLIDPTRYIDSVKQLYKLYGLKW